MAGVKKGTRGEDTVPLNWELSRESRLDSQLFRLNSQHLVSVRLIKPEWPLYEGKRIGSLSLFPFFPVNYNHNFWLPKVKLPYSCSISWVLNLEIFVIWEKSGNLILAKIKIMKFNTRYRSISDVEVYGQNKDLHIMSNIINIIRTKLSECKYLLHITICCTHLDFWKAYALLYLACLLICLELSLFAVVLIKLWIQFLVLWGQSKE